MNAREGQAPDGARASRIGTSNECSLVIDGGLLGRCRRSRGDGVVRRDQLRSDLDLGRDHDRDRPSEGLLLGHDA